MKKRNVVMPVVLLAVVFLVFLIRRWNEPERKEAFDRQPANVVYNRHALCRMDCHRISRKEVEEIMRKGVINFNRSNRMARPCPTFALQGRTASGESIRVVFAQCPDQTRVITCYNLKEEVDCYCSGDDEKEKF